MFNEEDRFLDYVKIYTVKSDESKGCTIELRGTNRFGDAVKLHVKSTDVPNAQLNGAVEKLGKAIFLASDFNEEALAGVVTVKFTESDGREQVIMTGKRSCGELEGSADVVFPAQFIGGQGAVANITRAAKEVRKLAAEYVEGDRPQGRLPLEDEA